MSDHTTHDEIWDYIMDTREELSGALARIMKLEERVRELEKDTPQARRLQREFDETLADNAAAGYGPDDYDEPA